MTSVKRGVDKAARSDRLAMTRRGAGKPAMRRTARRHSGAVRGHIDDSRGRFVVCARSSGARAVPRLFRRAAAQ
ncbi:hypothetical protein SALB1_2969 [Salinisphaera sp. LB1]|nr:hypothetical protein SALB1_2969 [Salinisphaera sp. LB1]